MTETTTIFKVISLQLIKINEKKNKTGDGNSECQPSRNQQTKMDWNG